MKKPSKAEERFQFFASQKSEKSSIKNWNVDDRPREKLLNKGKRALSDSELLAIIIGSGNRDESAVELAQRILASVEHNWNNLTKLSIEQLCSFRGIGEAKAINIITTLEIGKRRLEEMPETKPKYTSAESVYQQMHSTLGHLNHEEFWVIFVDRAHQEIKKFQISKGGISSTVVDVRLIMKEALTCGASALFLIHNHPSGNLEPSKSDEQITEKIKNASSFFDIQLLDHLIYTDHGFYSFHAHHLL